MFSFRFSRGRRADEGHLHRRQVPPRHEHGAQGPKAGKLAVLIKRYVRRIDPFFFISPFPSFLCEFGNFPFDHVFPLSHVYFGPCKSRLKSIKGGPLTSFPPT